MTDRWLLRGKLFQIVRHNLVELVSAEQSSYSTEVFAQDVAQAQKVSVRVNLDSSFSIAIVATAHHPDEGGSNRVSAWPDRYGLPEQSLYFTERRSWHRVPHTRFPARDLLRP